MSERLVHRNLPMLLLRARESVMRYFRRNLKEFNLTEQQWRVIRVLDQFGELETGKIAEEACILAPSLTGVLDRMEKVELINRYRVADDQRKVFAELTPKSKEMVVTLSGRIQEQYAQLEDLVGADKIADLNTLLDLLITLPAPDDEAAPVVREKLPVKRVKRTA